MAIFEIANWLADKHGVQNTVGMNIGGQTVQPFGTVKMTQAIHSSQLPDGAYGGEPAGFVLTIDGKRLYFACDTSLFSDMKMIGNGGLDSAAVPIGDLFTMGTNDSVEATKLLNPSVVFPQHYNTWPPIEQDAAAWAEMIRGQTNATPVVLQPGQSYSMD